MKGSETVTAKFASSLTVSPTSIDFGTVYLGTVTPRTVTVTNNGSSTVSITNPLVFIVPVGDSKEFLAENLCSKPLAPHKSCTIRISYIAGPFYHQQSAWLNVSDNTAASPKTVSLTGLTIDPAATLSPTSLSFGSLKTHVTSAAKTVTLTNSGATALSVQSITIGGSTPSDFKQANNCPSSLSAGAHCIISVTFNAVSKGAKSAKIELKDNAQNSPQSVPLSGTGD
jgi:archaellum component FlaF (FlaF/FlaG flagellin family)